MTENWVDGTYEAGGDDDRNDPIEQSGDTDALEGEGEGVELGIGQGSSFEPEEDVEAP